MPSHLIALGWNIVSKRTPGTVPVFAPLNPVMMRPRHPPPLRRTESSLFRQENSRLLVPQGVPTGGSQALVVGWAGLRQSYGG